MSSYVTLANKYRPQRFSDVIGQEIAIKIITKGLQKQRLGSAILFCGTRGVGKTTIARIIAKAFCCPNVDQLTSEPCCKCELCLGITNNNAIDVIEIDAASNTGVDDIREIIESCRYQPTVAKFKVFIIDEVHMLSKSAFNALLKTLEEPPQHVKFLFATTEAYKIPETILSRVIRLDLRALKNDLIAQYLSTICNRENISADINALLMIAKIADGSVRDSLSILDQAINFIDMNALSQADVRKMLGISDDVECIDLFRLICQKDTNNAIKTYRNLIQNTSCEKLINSLMDCVHVASCLQANISDDFFDISNSLVSQIKSITSDIALSSLTNIWQMLVKTANEIKFCERQDIVLEMMLIRIIYAIGLPDLREVLSQVNGDRSKNSTTQTALEKKSNVHNNRATQSGSCDIIGENSGGSLLDDTMKMFPGASVV